MEWFSNLLDNKFENEKNIVLKYKLFYTNRYRSLVSKDFKKLMKNINYIHYYKTPLHYINDYVYILKNK